jgi:hypothetical protein
VRNCPTDMLRALFGCRCFVMPPLKNFRLVGGTCSTNDWLLPIVDTTFLLLDTGDRALLSLDRVLSRASSLRRSLRESLALLSLAL